MTITHLDDEPLDLLHPLDLLEKALGPAMPAVVTSPHPALDAARYHTQVEFDRTYRSIRREPVYNNKNLLFISGVNQHVDRTALLRVLGPLPDSASCCRSAARCQPSRQCGNRSIGS